MKAEPVLTTEEIEDYLHCGLFYRFRYDLEFPYRDKTNHGPLVAASRIALQGYLTNIAKGLSKAEARNHVGRRLHMFWVKHHYPEHGFPMAHAQMLRIFHEVGRMIKPHDLIIGGGLTAGMSMLGITIEDKIDGLWVEKYGKRGTPIEKQTMIGVRIMSDQYVNKSARLSTVLPALVKYTMNTVGGTALGHGHPSKLVIIHVPSMRKKWYNLVTQDYREAKWLIQSIIRGLNKQVFNPTDYESRCAQCWYRGVCSNYFTNEVLGTKRVGPARHMMESHARSVDEVRAVSGGLLDRDKSLPFFGPSPGTTLEA